MIERALSLVARFADLLAATARRPDPIAIPIRHDDRRGPARGDRRH